MNTSKSSLQSQIANLSAILELWVPVLEEMKKMHANLEELPASVKQLHAQFQDLKKSDRTPETSEEIDQIKNVQSQLQKSTRNLEAALPQLTELEKKVNNLLALKERLEALQDSLQPTEATNYAGEFELLKQKLETAQEPRYCQEPFGQLLKTTQESGYEQESYRQLLEMVDNSGSNRNYFVKSSLKERSLFGLKFGITLITGALVGWGLISLFKSVPKTDSGNSDIKQTEVLPKVELNR